MNKRTQTFLSDLPQEVMEVVLAFAIPPEEDIALHISTCPDLRCEVVDGVISRIRTLRLVSRHLSQTLDASPLGCLCVRMSKSYNPLSSVFPPSHINISNAVSVDIDVGYITNTLIANLSDVIRGTNSLIRLSIAGFEESDNKPSLSMIAEPISTLLSERNISGSFRALLLDVPIDSYHLLLAHNAHLLLAAFHITSNRPIIRSPDSMIVWNQLHSLSIYSEASTPSISNAFSLFPPGSIPNVTKVALLSNDRHSVDDLPLIFQSIGGSVTDLKLTFGGLCLGLPSFPSSDILQHFACNYDQASSLLNGVYSSLTSILLHGFTSRIEDIKKNIPLAGPGPSVARLVDLSLWNITQVTRTPKLKRLTLEYPFASVLTTRETDIGESVRYAYWGARLPQRGVDFLDANKEPIMPDCWNTAYPRSPAFYM